MILTRNKIVYMQKCESSEVIPTNQHKYQIS